MIQPNFNSEGGRSKRLASFNLCGPLHSANPQLPIHRCQSMPTRLRRLLSRRENLLAARRVLILSRLRNLHADEQSLRTRRRRHRRVALVKNGAGVASRLRPGLLFAFFFTCLLHNILRSARNRSRTYASKVSS